MAETCRGRRLQEPLPLADLRQSERIGRCFAVGALAIGDPAYFAVKRSGIPRPRLYRTRQLAVQADCAVWPVNGHSPTTAHELCIAAPSSRTGDVRDTTRGATCGISNPRGLDPRLTAIVERIRAIERLARARGAR